MQAHSCMHQAEQCVTSRSTKVKTSHIACQKRVSNKRWCITWQPLCNAQIGPQQGLCKVAFVHQLYYCMITKACKRRASCSETALMLFRWHWSYLEFASFGKGTVQNGQKGLKQPDRVADCILGSRKMQACNCGPTWWQMSGRYSEGSLSCLCKKCLWSSTLSSW